MDESSINCIFEIKQTKNGLGLLASRNIKRGELILAEKPLIKIKQNVPKLQLNFHVENQVSKLSDQDKAKIFELHDNQIPKSLVGIFKTNSYMLGKKSQFCGLFYKMARMNHSCLPNASHHWVESENLQKVFALKDISLGEEICTSYINLYEDTLGRKRILKKSFYFDCTCELCVKESSYMEKSDERRIILNDLNNFRPRMGLRDPNMFLSKKKLMLQLLEEEGIDYDAYCVHKIAYDIFSFLFRTNGSRDSLKFWALKAYDNAIICQGEVTGSLKDEILNFVEKN